MSLDVLPLALSDLKIGSNGGSELVFSFSGFYFQFTSFANACGNSTRGWIGAFVFPWLFTLVVHA